MAINVTLKQNVGSAVVTIIDPQGRVARTIPLPTTTGTSDAVWNLRWPDAVGFPGLIYWQGTNQGPKADIGTHTAHLTVDGHTLTQSFDILKDARLRSNQDPLNFPIKLNNKIAHLHGVIESVDARPTDQTVEVFDLLSGQLRVQLDQLADIVNDDIPGFNDLVTGVGLPPITCTATRTD